MNNLIEDTIAAIATPPGEGGIAVIRVSGEEAISIVDRCFSRSIEQVDSHTVHYGKIIEPETKLILDEVLVTVMRAPRSFTTENTVEVSCHGGIVSVKKVLACLLAQGARLAEPGEFTKRAFLGGRIDLAQAEAVMDLIRSKSDRAFSIAMKQSEGALSGDIRKIRQTLLETMAHIEVNIDYPEHDVEDLTNTFIKEKCADARRAVEQILHRAGQGKILRDGIMTAIVGRPNVGKSSLLNELLQENRAIVTDIAGTTRDVIEEYVQVNGIPLKLLDTAGIRDTSDVVEQIGVERSKVAVQEADLLLFVLNNNEPLHDDERELMEALVGRQVIVIINKVDLAQKVELDEVERAFGKESIVQMSLLEQTGRDALEKVIADKFFDGELESNDLTYVSNVRHIHLLEQTLRALDDAIAACGDYVPIDIMQIDVHAAWELLGEVVGDAVNESLLDQIFSQFCLGK
jgi:tRNA modification GTPase